MQIKKTVTIVLVLLLVMNFNALHLHAENSKENESVSEGTIEIIDPLTKNVVKTFTPTDYQIATNIVQYKKEIEQWAHQFTHGSENSSGYTKPMILDRIDNKGKIIKGRPIITVNESKLVDEILQHSFSGGKIELPLIYIHSNYSERDIPYLKEVAIASFTTYFKAHKTGRSKNIELSTKAINNVIVGNNDIFSFNSVVGPRDVAAGYQMAPEIIHGKMVMGIGGGICQTSSTLFNAVDQLNIKIIERHKHSKDVGYVREGRDATVSFGGLDFKFQNSLGIPILVRTYYQKGAVTVQITTSREYYNFLRNQ